MSGGTSRRIGLTAGARTYSDADALARAEVCISDTYKTETKPPMRIAPSVLSNDVGVSADVEFADMARVRAAGEFGLQTTRRGYGNGRGEATMAEDVSRGGDRGWDTYSIVLSLGIQDGVGAEGQ